jgi:hypothetical protein
MGIFSRQSTLSRFQTPAALGEVTVFEDMDAVLKRGEPLLT